MRHYLLGLVIIFSTTNVYSQFSAKAHFDKSTWNQFKQGKTYMVLENEGNSEYDKTLQAAVKEHWTFNDFEFIGSDKYKELYTDPSNFFLLRINLDYTKKRDGAVAVSHDLVYLYLVQGNKKGRLSSFPILADMQIAAQYEDDEDYIYKLPIFLKYFQWYSELVTKGKVKSGSNFKAIIKENRPQIKAKPLFVLDTDLNSKIETVEDIRKNYSGEVYVVSKEEFIQKMNEDVNDINFFVCIVSSGKAWDYVYNVKSGWLLYYSYNIISKTWPAGIIPYHYKRWN